MKIVKLAALLLAGAGILLSSCCEKNDPEVGQFSYTVTFDTRGLAKEGTIPDAQHVISGGSVIEPAKPEAERNKYTGQRDIIFVGWYKDENRTEPWDFDNDC